MPDTTQNANTVLSDQGHQDKVNKVSKMDPEKKRALF